MWLIAIVATIFAAAVLIKRLRSPLAKIPGPPMTRITSIWLKLHEFSANRRLFVHQLHKKYGPIVRLSPNEVSFTSPEAVKEIYASGGSGYDKTEFYDLFRQFGQRQVIMLQSMCLSICRLSDESSIARTMFSTLPKKDVSISLDCNMICSKYNPA